MLSFPLCPGTAEGFRLDTPLLLCSPEMALWQQRAQEGLAEAGQSDRVLLHLQNRWRAGKCGEVWGFTMLDTTMCPEGTETAQGDQFSSEWEQKGHPASAQPL